ncbi:MAG: ABC transporter permease subunit, partial [Bdellovibrionota bacterium]
MYSPIPTTHLKRYPISTGDFAVFGLVILAIYGSVSMAQRWTGGLQTEVVIELGATNLLLYSLFSLYRALIAYGLSLAFTIVFGYMAAKNKVAERIILPLLDVGQSIPVLGFLPGLVLGLISIFPHSNMGLELACILMIFTGQVWNMAFGFYASLKAVPTQFHELSQNIALSSMQKLRQVELPYSASSLAWNSLMSMAGGWFFLTVCEAFTLGNKQFRLPGLGSYMALAIEQGDTRSMIEGVTAMIVMIVLVDFVFWRPIIAWTRKFRLDEQSEDAQDIPFMQLLYEDSKVGKVLRNLLRLLKAVGSLLLKLADRFFSLWRGKMKLPKVATQLEKWFSRAPFWLFFLLLSPVVIVVIGRLYLLLAPLRGDMVLTIATATLKTFARVLFAMTVSCCWAVPFGIWVGMSARL